ncbi:MAG: hypothetical protein JWM28_4524 [Chitinophagaceae bacterium]|nr:hypothetical protein [Chitinophagaceae bacterium]
MKRHSVFDGNICTPSFPLDVIRLCDTLLAASHEPQAMSYDTDSCVTFLSLAARSLQLAALSSAVTFLSLGAYSPQLAARSLQLEARSFPY